MSILKINCAECMKDNHAGCTHEECLCRADQHGENLRNGAKYNVMMNHPDHEPRDYEKALEFEEDYEDLIDNGPGNNDPAYSIIELARLMIYHKHWVSKLELYRELNHWARKYRADDDDVQLAIDTVFADMECFECIKGISQDLGRQKKNILFDTTQLIETGEWIKGRLEIKRIELTGDMLWFNDQYYQHEAEAQIRRIARQRIAKAKNKDISEVVKYVEDTCHVINWTDIEKSIHLKCLLNGIYDIKTGIFYTKFNPDYIILNQIPHSYSEDNTFEKIHEKVTELIPIEKERQSYYDFISTCMHPYTGVDYQFGTIGGTGTGKSQLGKLAQMTLGNENVGDATIHLIAKDQTTQKNMAFKMLNIDYDLNSESIKQIDVIKKWITQDGFTARGIYAQSTTFRPMSRLMFMANELYEIDNEDDAEAVYDRTYIIRVDKKFRHQKEEIKRVMEKTATDEQMNGFITYLLKNATWIAQNETIHHVMDVNDVENIWNTFGNRIKMFIKKWIVMSPSAKTDSGDPYNKWMKHCMDNKFKPKDKKRFSEIFNENVGITPTNSRIDGDNWYGYVGFRLKTDEEVAKDEMVLFAAE